MIEWTEQEEQEIIDRAKAGDPQANYELSLWALQRADEEPDEPRWNRLAAKCLVKAAQAGYGPAQEKLEGLLSRKDRPAPPQQTASSQDEPRTAARTSGRQTASRRSDGDTSARRTVPEEYDYSDDEPEDEYTRPERARRWRGITLPFANWGDAQWKRVEIICIAICVVLAILIAVMLITGRKNKTETEDTSAIPPAAAVEPAASPTPTPEPYPDQATRDAIEAADLEIYPDELDYVDTPTTATVSVGNILRLRTGPNTTYTELAQMPNGTKLSIYADKNSWALVLYEDTWGWCSNEYLIRD